MLTFFLTSHPQFQKGTSRTLNRDRAEKEKSSPSPRIRVPLSLFFERARESTGARRTTKLLPTIQTPNPEERGKKNPNPPSLSVFSSRVEKKTTEPRCRCPRTSTGCPSRRARGSPARTRRCAGSRASSGTGKKGVFLEFSPFFPPVSSLSLSLSHLFPLPPPHITTTITLAGGRRSPSASPGERASSAPSAGATN